MHVYAAACVFRVLHEQGIPTKIAPTECVKKSGYEFIPDEIYQMLHKSPCLKGQVDQFRKDTSDGGAWCNFDTIAAVTHAWEVFEWEPVKGYYNNAEESLLVKAWD